MPDSPRERLVLSEIAIGSPCPISWDEIGGSGQVRHCHVCQKIVFDVIEMTTAEATRVLSDGETLPCVRLCRGGDGEVVTADRLPGVRGRIWKRLRRHGRLAASLFAVVFLPGCQSLVNTFLTYGAPARSVREDPSKLEAAIASTKPETTDVGVQDGHRSSGTER